MIKAFQEGSRSIDMLAEAREAAGPVFAAALEKAVNFKLHVKELQEKGVPEPTIDKQVHEETVQFVKFVNDNKLDYKKIFYGADLMIALLEVEELRHRMAS